MKHSGTEISKKNHKLQGIPRVVAAACGVDRVDPTRPPAESGNVEEQSVPSDCASSDPTVLAIPQWWPSPELFTTAKKDFLTISTCIDLPGRSRGTHRPVPERPLWRSLTYFSLQWPANTG